MFPLTISFAVLLPVSQALMLAGGATQGGTCAVTVAVEVCAPGPGSISFVAVICAVLEIVPGVVGLTMIVTVAIAPLAIGPIAHVTVPLAFAHPGEAETNVTLPGKTSFTVEPVEFDGPLFLTLIV